MSLNFGLIHSEFNFNVASNSDRIVYVFDDYRLDTSLRMLFRDERELALPPKAVETLTALIESRGEIVAKDDLMKAIWTDTIVEESNLAHHLHVLRKALGQNRNGRPFIETFRGRGYRFNSEVEVTDDSGSSKPNGHTNGSKPSYTPSGNVAISATGYGGMNLLRGWPLAGTVGALLLVLASAAVFYVQLRSEAASKIADFSVTPLTSGVAVLDATISKDGRFFVYHEADGVNVQLWLQQTDRTGRIEIIPKGDRVIGGKTFSPNGEFVYFVGQEKGGIGFSLFRVPTFGGPMAKVLDDIASPVSFSPNADEIAFIRYDQKAGASQIVVSAAEGGRERILLTVPGESILSSGAAWSPDGEEIAFGMIEQETESAEGRCSITAVAVRSSKVRQLSAERWDTCYRMMWTSDGEGVVFIGTRLGEIYTPRRDQVYYLSVAQRRSRRVSTDGSRYQDVSLGITNDNALLVVPTNRLSQIWVMDASGDARTAVQLTNGLSDGIAGVAPLHDGRIGYVSRVGENRSIWLMNADGSNQHQISDQLPYIEELRATPDGRFFVVSARRDGFSHLYRMDPDGGNLKRLTDGESYTVDSTISPDSRWVYYGFGYLERGRWHTRLQKTDIDSGETFVVKVLEIPGFVPHISPDGSMIAGVTQTGLKLFSPSDGSVIDEVKTERAGDLQGGAKWTPDGRSLTYPVTRGTTGNVWTQSVDGSGSRPLTDFPNGYLYFHVFSPDGTKLYVARGYQVRDPVLIRNFK